MLKRILFFFAFALMAGQFVSAQITTSTITGSIKSTTDEALVGATVVATHVPTGTKYTAVSRNGGSIRMENLRSGGPYTIEVSYVGYDKETYTDVYLQLAESFILNPVLKKTEKVMETVVLTTTGRSQILNKNRTGAVTNIGLRMINQMPTVTRSLNDLTRATPQSNGASIGGGNFRQNNFTIDGADFNNSFGIGSNLPAGGAPISLDAVQEISVNITPFDVRQSGFIGSAINAVTRSGTNDFSGSVYKYFRNEKYRGDEVDGVKFVRPVEDFSQWGFRFGGPIIKNKLFFFINYETESKPKPIQTRFAATAAAPYGSSPNVARPTADSLNFISNYLLSNYGYVTGPYDNYTPNEERKKYMARLDWNISNKHQLVLRYSQVEGGEPFPVSGSVGGTGITEAAADNRNQVHALWFKNSNYFQGANFYSFAAELNSSWGKVSNVLRGTYTYQNDSRSTESQIFPFVDIMSTSSASRSLPYTSFGHEPFSFGNLRKVKVYSVVDNFSWTKNKHSWTVGGQFEQSETINGFQRFATSFYRFPTWNAFATGQLPSDFAITYSLSKNFAPAFSSFKFRQLSFYGQDEIAVSRNFRLTFGLRLDLPSYPDVPQIVTHPLVAAKTFENGEIVNTGNLPKVRFMWSPRMGFNWDVYGDRTLQIRGGTGIFTGKVPFVWIVSQSGDNGMIQVTRNFNTPADIAANAGPFNPNPYAYLPGSVPQAGTVVPASVTAMDEDFRNPQSWKSSIAMDAKMPWGLIGSVEAIFNKDLKTVFFRNPNYQLPQNLNVAGYPDNRPIYGATIQTKFIHTLSGAGLFVPGGSSQFNPVIIDNAPTSKGYYGSITFKVEKPFSKGFSGMVAYTKSLSANLHDGSGDQPLGTYQGTQQVNSLNTPALSHSAYVLPDRFVAAVSYRKEYLKHMASTISLFWSGASDYRFTYVYSGDFNRDNISGNDLIFIPTATQVQQMLFNSQTVNGVVYNQQAQRDLFENYIQQDKYLRNRRGQYAERNGGLAPWRNQLDVKFMQDVFVKAGKYRNTLQFTVDILNAGNLINNSWGKVKATNNTSILGIANAGNLVPGGSVLPVFTLAQDRGQMITRTFRDVVSTSSTYSIQLGIRYIFNN
ncbi:MAG: TonB-dependent receptor [Chitinophagaceae bacterium]|nr:TonB-dependent receptor [Chitinophagaceae bacterium]